MTSDSYAMMTVPYEWILENVGEEPMTIASKMISFRGEKVFRVGLKNHAVDPVLFFVVFDLNKIGMEVLDVTYGIQGDGTGPAKMKKMKNEEISDNDMYNLDIFKTVLDKKIVGNCTIAFRIVISGNYPDKYFYLLSDRLAKDQLWAALKNQQHLPDVELIVKDKTFPAHKAILAARRAFAVEFENEFEKVLQPVKNVPHQIRIDGVDPSTVEKFLHFIYTGETMGTLADEKLQELTREYGRSDEDFTLAFMCHVALSETRATDLTKFMECLNDGVGVLSSSLIMPEKDTEISFERTPTFRCTMWFDRITYSDYHESNMGERKCIMEYQKEQLFFAYITAGHFGEHRITKAVIHVTCAKHKRFGLKIEDVYCSLQEPNQWYKMEPKKSENSELLQHFTVQFETLEFSYQRNFEIIFDIKTVCTIENYHYELMDENWCKDLWAAAINKKLTDVEIFVGTFKLMEAHRVILCARSPVLNSSLISNAEKSIVTFGVEFDKDVLHYFLKFLYTGRLKVCPKVMQMSQLAAMYEVETLKNICQLLIASPPDAEQVTNYLLEL